MDNAALEFWLGLQGDYETLEIFRRGRRNGGAKLAFCKTAVNQNCVVSHGDGESLAAEQVEGRSLLLHVTRGQPFFYEPLFYRQAKPLD